MYGNENAGDYTLYSGAGDYTMPKNDEIETSDYLKVAAYKNNSQPLIFKEITVVKGDTLYSLSKKHNTSLNDLAVINKLSSPYNLSIGQKLKLQDFPVSVSGAPAIMAVTKPVYSFKEISVSKGDTLYSLSRSYQFPVNDLAVINKLSSPFSLSIGQKLKVPNIGPKESVTTNIQTVRQANKNAVVGKLSDNSVSIQKKKISSNPAKTLPKISSRSSSKFSWPIRGKTLSGYGAKSNGLFNDGINIGAPAGRSVVAAENGVVAYAGNELKGMGNLVIVQHSGGWMTVYAHLGDMYVRRGIKVMVNQKIGTIGSTGKVDSPQLHFEIRKGTKAYDPTSRLK